MGCGPGKGPQKRYTNVVLVLVLVVVIKYSKIP